MYDWCWVSRSAKINRGRGRTMSLFSLGIVLEGEFGVIFVYKLYTLYPMDEFEETFPDISKSCVCGLFVCLYCQLLPNMNLALKNSYQTGICF